jgi:membrane carboxypeptidase/penicillin-binding protein
MRVFAKVMVVGLLGLLTTAAIGFYWMDYYSGDLPDINYLVQFAPSQAGKATVECTSRQTDVIPFSLLGKNLMFAFHAAERDNRETDKYRPSLSLQIAKWLFCQPSPALKQAMQELRTSVQLNRRYSPEQLLTIYLNGAYFGDDIWGAQTAAQHFFHKNPNELGLAETALLAGILRAPTYYSPIKHPERALARRNEVLDGMAATGEISATDAAAAKMSSLLPIE